jgi:hypothetical protein
MMSQSTPRAAYLGVALGLMLAPAVSEAQQVNLKAAVEAKVAAGKTASARTTPDAASSVGTFISFDVPGAVNGTFPYSIDPAGAIAGIYFDANFIGHGFIRASNGTITTFNVPGAVNGLFAPLASSAAGAITGTYADTNVAFHGFIRATNGTITSFDAPGAGTDFFEGTQALGINPPGAVSGASIDSNSVSHGFLRGRNGLITTFDAPGACTTCPFDGGTFVGTVAADISPAGTIIGVYSDASNNNHGFLRASDGSFTTFDPPGRINVFFFPFVNSATDLYINQAGLVTGAFFESISGNPLGGNFRVFVQAPDGTLTTFDAATYPPCCIWSFPLGINPAGVITGGFNDGFNVNRGFLRTSDGTVTIIDAPGAGTGSGQGTLPLGINPAGMITGNYVNANGTHGFVLLPSEMASGSFQ